MLIQSNLLGCRHCFDHDLTRYDQIVHDNTIDVLAAIFIWYRFEPASSTAGGSFLYFSLCLEHIGLRHMVHQFLKKLHPHQSSGGDLSYKDLYSTNRSCWLSPTPSQIRELGSDTLVDFCDPFPHKKHVKSTILYMKHTIYTWKTCSELPNVTAKWHICF